MKLGSLITPITTEKSAAAQEKGIYTFLVGREATKIDVKQAFEKMYGEKVEKVQMLYIRPKTRAIGKGTIIQKRKLLKKAVIKLKNSKKIDLYKTETK